MRNLPLGMIWACLMCTATAALAQPESELDVLRAELAQMRADYESRIAQLEERLDEAERKAEAGEPPARPVAANQLALEQPQQPPVRQPDAARA